MSWELPEAKRVELLTELECTVKGFDASIDAIRFNQSHNIGDQSIQRAELQDLMIERSRAIREMKHLNALDPLNGGPARSPHVAYNRFRRG
jgi:hypothetical protein